MYTLYYSPGTIALAPHILLRELGVPFEAIRVAVADNDHRNYRTPEFLQVSARGFVPVLVIGNNKLTESVAIALHLAELAPAKRWLPPTATIERARVYQWLAWLATSVLRAIGGVYRPEHLVNIKELYPPIRAAAENKLRVFFEEIEAKIRPGSDYFIGDNFGLVDPFLLVFYRWGGEIGIEMRDFAGWTQLTAAMLERPAVAQALATEEIEINGFGVRPAL